MKRQGTSHREESVSEFLDRQYLEADNRAELDYWEPLARVIMEVIESRHAQGLSQAELASIMKTKQSVISRFESMGRKPNYDFLARLSIALGHAPGMTLYGEFLAVVRQEQQEVVRRMAARQGVSSQSLVDALLAEAIAAKEAEVSWIARVLGGTTDSQLPTVSIVTEQNAAVGISECLTQEVLHHGPGYYRHDLLQHPHVDQGANVSVIGQGSAAGTCADSLIKIA